MTTTRIPQYRLHKPSGNGFVRAKGRMYYLGKYGSPDSLARYRAFLADFQAGGGSVSPPAHGRPLSVGELAELYLAREEARFGLKGKPAYEARYSMLALTTCHAALEARTFGPRALKQVQERLVREGKLARSEVNRRVNRIRAAFKWAVSEELIPPECLVALQSVPGLRYGAARENPPRTPANPAHVASVVEWLRANGRPGAAAALAFIRATGCRPDEACRLTLADVDRSGSLPVYRVRRHKTAHHGHVRLVPLNPAALAAVESVSGTRLHEPVFRWSEGPAAGEPVTPNGLLQVLYKACDGLGLPRFYPYQLRHLVATEVVNASGSDSMASALLGHSPSSTVVRRYSRDRLALAAEGARFVGVSA